MPRAKPERVPISDDPPKHSAADVAECLGISEDTVYRMAKRGEIAHVPVAGLIRFRKSAIDAYLAKREKRAGAGKVSQAAREQFNMR